MNAREVKKTLNITQQTLSRYAREGKIRFVAINPYHYKYNDEDVYRLIGLSSVKENKTSVTYSRVSLPKQKSDLASQTKRLYDFSASNGIIISRQIEDIKSGMNFTDRKGMLLLIEDVIKGNIDKVVIENRDRLARFGFELFETFFKYFGTTIVVTSNADNKSYEQELTQDLVSIIHYFSMKSYSHRRRLNKLKKELGNK